MIRVLGLKVGRIVLDPGHGGHDTGTIGPEGLREKDLVLDVAQRLGRLIEDTDGQRSDLHAHRRYVRSAGAAHRNRQRGQSRSVPVDSCQFIAVAQRPRAWRPIYLNFTTSKSALDLAARENAGRR